MGWEWVACHFLREVMITESLCEIVFMYVGCDMPLYAFSLFLPTIINQICHKFCILICGSKSKFSAWYILQLSMVKLAILTTILLFKDSQPPQKTFSPFWFMFLPVLLHVWSDFWQIIRVRGAISICAS